MKNDFTPEEVLEQIKTLDRDFVDVITVMYNKKDWCEKNNYNFDNLVKEKENFEFSPIIQKNELKFEFRIFIDSEPEFILEYINDIKNYINQLKISHPIFHLLKKNYLNFKQNEERQIKIIRAMME